jgi:hypothetical protein
MKTDMRLFGSRTKTAIKTNLKTRLDEKRNNHQVEELLKHLLEGLEGYKSAIYSNYHEYKQNPDQFNAEKNINAFWQLMNTFLLDLVERPEHVDSVLLEKPVQEILSPYFEEIGYLVEFYIHSLFSDWFPYYTVTVAKLYSRKQADETLLGYTLHYTIEHIQTLGPSIIFGVSSFFDPRKTKIRIDHSMTDCIYNESLTALMKEEKNFVETTTQKPYKETVLEHILFHEKMHCLFHLLKQENYSYENKDPATVFNFLVMSEVWARLATLLMSNGAIIYELNNLMELKMTGDPVYYATYEFLNRFTSIFEIFKNTSLSLNGVILKCRALALKSLHMTADWINKNMGHESDKKWSELIRTMQQEYGKDTSSYPQLNKKYRPVFNMKQ